MEQVIDEQPTAIRTKPRNGFIAFLLSLFLPGLAQVYNGQPKKAILFFGLLLFFPLVFGLTRGMTFFYGMVMFCIIELSLRIYIIIDGVRHAKRQQEYVLKPYNTWYHHVLIAIGMLAILMVYDISTMLGIATFRIPTPSNNPTFQVGDWIVADMRAYKNTQPDYGDIVVFSRPDGQIYAFRVVGKPTDTLELIDNVVSINGKPSKATFIKDTTSDDVPVGVFEEALPNGHKHLMYTFKQPRDSAKMNIKNIIVPADSYYLLGDNRDNAADSRYEGFISKDRITGRVIYSYWGSTGSKRMNIDFRDK
jgi:signal peptidase I